MSCHPSLKKSDIIYSNNWCLTVGTPYLFDDWIDLDMPRDQREKHLAEAKTYCEKCPENTNFTEYCAILKEKERNRK